MDKKKTEENLSKNREAPSVAFLYEMVQVNLHCSIWKVLQQHFERSKPITC